MLTLGLILLSLNTTRLGRSFLCLSHQIRRMIRITGRDGRRSSSPSHLVGAAVVQEVCSGLDLHISTRLILTHSRRSIVKRSLRSTISIIRRRTEYLCFRCTRKHNCRCCCGKLALQLYRSQVRQASCIYTHNHRHDGSLFLGCCCQKLRLAGCIACS